METKIKRKIGVNVGNWRRFRNMSQGDLARHLKISENQVSLYERGETNISAVRLLRISEILDKPIEVFFG